MMRALRWPLLASAALLACDSATEIETGGEGRIRIQIVTVGSDPQSDEYLVTLDGTRPLSVAPNGSTTYNAVPEGTHVVHLFSLADNCAVSGGTSPRSVQVHGGGSSEITFNVICSAPVTGGFRIAVSTTGSQTDDDGYILAVTGTQLRNIAVNAEETYSGLPPGARLITLKDVAEFCKVEGGNPQLYTVVAGKAVLVAIRVGCGRPGPVE
jgi:hypothetical protein